MQNVGLLVVCVRLDGDNTLQSDDDSSISTLMKTTPRLTKKGRPFDHHEQRMIDEGK